MTVACEIEYRDLPGFPGYRVGNDGRIESCRPRNGKGSMLPSWRRVKPILTEGRRYCQVGFRIGGRAFRREVHAVVALAFLGLRPSGMEVAHKNGVSTDNRVENLEYVTHKTNEAHKLEHGTSSRGSRNAGAKLTDDDVRTIRTRVASGDRQYVVARDYNICGSTVSLIVNRERWGHVA